jgi:hypothetical protein
VPSTGFAKDVLPVGVQRRVNKDPHTKESGTASSLLCVGSHDLNILLQNNKFNFIPSDSRTAWDAATESEVHFQIVTLKMYLSVTAPPDIQSCRCAVLVIAGYISYQHNVTALRNLESVLC